MPMETDTETTARIQELERQLNAAFRNILRLSRELIKLKSSAASGSQAVGPRPKSSHKR